MKQSKYFFCYNARLSTFLREVKQLDYITIAKHPASDAKFTLFEQSEALQIGIKEYKQLTK
ncbi:hypothetical protein SAMN06296056_104241 [Priestia filamentosa]|nr:hypothetical protein B1B01_17245 [Priestia filamentosa]SMF53540.1 hypothetical protein SAMN06296056_104241 [Priestia filamentosa]